MKHISDVLREERIRKGLSIDDVVASTKIRKSFVVAIEEGKFQELPSETYALGFVKNYGSFLGISESRTTALFRREYEVRNTDNAPKFRKAISHSKDAFSIKSPKGLLALCVLVVLISYFVYQFSFLFFGPKLEVVSPTNNSIAESNVVVVSGKTEPSAQVLVNGEAVYVDLSGSFKKSLYIEEDQEIEIVAKNNSGRETKQTITVQIE